MPVAAVAGTMASRGVLLVAEVVGHLAFEHALDEASSELVEEVALGEQVFGFVAVLKELVETGFVEQRPGQRDKRQRRLHATATGRDLAIRLAELQGRRIGRALEAAGPDAAPIIQRYLAGLIDPAERNGVMAQLAGST